MKKRIFLSVSMGLAVLFSAFGLVSCGRAESYTVDVLLTEAEGYTVLSENPVTVPAGSDADRQENPFFHKEISRALK